MAPEMPAPAGRPAPDDDYDATDFSALRGGRRPALVFVIELEEHPRATVQAEHAADELRLLDDLSHRLPQLEREVLRVLVSALHQLDARSLGLAAADIGRRPA